MQKIEFINSKYKVESVATGRVLPVELVSNKLIYAMVSEFGITKTAQAVQALYDADLLSFDESEALLEVLNNMILNDLAHYGECEGYEHFSPIVLH